MILKDKVAVISGAGSGIGAATGRELARAGARVHLVDIRADRLEQVRAEIEALGGQATSHCLDCTDHAAMQALADLIYDQEGRVDVLQNGVGVLVAAPAEQLTRADWQRAIDLNLWSVINGLQAFLPRLLQQGGKAHVVIISSMAGLVGFPYTLPYTTTKFALVGLAEALGLELAGTGIRVTAVCPGMVRSNLVQDGLLRLPGRWVSRFQAAYANWAPEAEGVAQQIRRAIERGRPLILPSLALAQAWRIKRLSGGFYNRAATLSMATLRRLGSI